MRSAPTMLHVRRRAAEAIVKGERVRVLHLIERSGNGWAESRITAICSFQGQTNLPPTCAQATPSKPSCTTCAPVKVT